MLVAVVGAGPNGLTAALDLARSGADVHVLERNDTIGGGARSARLTGDGLVHDVCSAIHPFGAASPAFRRLRLDRFGLEWRHAPVALAHPLDDGTAAVLHQDLDATVAGLGRDGPAWRALFGLPLARADELFAEVLQPLLHVPRDLRALLGFAHAAAPASWLARAAFREEHARALFAGIAAHAFLPLDRPFTAAFALMLGVAGHHVGWPVAAGGSQAIVDALGTALEEAGGKITTGTEVADLGDLPALVGGVPDATLLDVTPHQLLGMAGERLPGPARRRLARYRHGPAAFKVDYAVRGGVPWTAEPCRRAACVHVGGTLEQVAAAERATSRGALVPDPFVLVGQQYLADPARTAAAARDDIVPVWAYAHVPRGFSGDATHLVDAQIERFAPGFTERVVDRHVMGPAAFEAYNPNYVGGDIGGGAHDGLQLFARPRLAVDPYRTAVPDVWLCSASTPPGGGVHGMCGANAAASVLRARA